MHRTKQNKRSSSAQVGDKRRIKGQRRSCILLRLKKPKKKEGRYRAQESPSSHQRQIFPSLHFLLLKPPTHLLLKVSFLGPNNRVGLNYPVSIRTLVSFFEVNGNRHHFEQQ